MNKKILIILIVCFIQILISGCMGNIEVTSTSVEEFVGNKPDIQATNTNLPEIKQNCWEPDWQEVWEGKSQLISMAEGPNNVFWFLTTDTIDSVSTVDGNFQSYSLSDMLLCEDCKQNFHGKLVVSTRGEAWIGLDTDLLILDQNGNWRIISTEDIKTELIDHYGVRVLLSDNNGNIWISFTDNLCSYDGMAWHCNQFQDLHRIYTRDNVEYQGIAHILSAVSGSGHEIWFGAEDGIILKFDGDKFEVIEISEMISDQTLTPRFGSLAYDYATNTLWALNTFNALSDDSIAVYRRNEDESWQIYNEDLFFSEDVNSHYLSMHSISVTNDGKVWLGMVFGLSLVHYDGSEWHTFDGRQLPLEKSDFPFRSFTDINNCIKPTNYIADILATNNGNLLVGDVGAAYIYQP